ncbi:MAG TPA: hypothetical protein DIT67_02720 [Octadecabacter sp.]|nr:hypothetical protein [Octadecabacter sp.]
MQLKMSLCKIRIAPRGRFCSGLDWAASHSCLKHPLRAIAVFGLIALAACVTPPQAQTSADGPSFLACTTDGIDFNVRNETPAGVLVDFVDSQLEREFVEHTSASTSSGPVSLTTYRTTTAPDPFRLTIARDTQSTLARLLFADGADLAATCTTIQG